MRAIFIFMLVCFSLSSYSQNYDLPPNPKPGKCYVKCCPIDFNYNKKYSGVWSEIDCDLAKAKKQKRTITITYGHARSRFCGTIKKICR